MTTVCFTCSGPKAVQNQVAKMAAIGAQSRSGTMVCLPTDVQLLSSKGLRVLVLVDDKSADLQLDLAVDLFWNEAARLRALAGADEDRIEEL